MRIPHIKCSTTWIDGIVYEKQPTDRPTDCMPESNVNTQYLSSAFNSHKSAGYKPYVFVALFFLLVAYFVVN